MHRGLFVCCALCKNVVGYIVVPGLVRSSDQKEEVPMIAVRNPEPSPPFEESPIPLPPKVSAPLEGWGPAVFPDGIEDLHRVMEEVHIEAVSSMFANRWLRKALSEVRSCGRFEPARTDDGYVWNQAYYHTLPCGAEVAVLMPARLEGIPAIRHATVYLKHEADALNETIKRELKTLMCALYNTVKRP